MKNFIFFNIKNTNFNFKLDFWIIKNDIFNYYYSNQIFKSGYVDVELGSYYALSKNKLNVKILRKNPNFYETAK